MNFKRKEMKPKVWSGLDLLLREEKRSRKFRGNVGYLCHAASVDHRLQHGLIAMKDLFGSRLKAVFSPQHGLFGDAQDDMIETDHSIHPYFKVPVYSLYSDVRSPTPGMLDGIDHLFVDLQDIGSRPYTYVSTLLLTMEACGKYGVEVIVLDRPNPVNGLCIEGNMLQPEFSSFVGMYPLPVRHGMTLAEMALMGNLIRKISCQLRIISMEGWKRWMYFEDTGLPWVQPSPNMPNVETALIFPATVIFEGTNLSEGRGTTKSLEVVGHPALDPFAFTDKVHSVFKRVNAKGFVLRPFYFEPVYQKHQNKMCGGFQIHVTDRESFLPWMTGQILLRELREFLNGLFEWKSPPFEYDDIHLPIDLINGTDELRAWVVNGGSVEDLEKIENKGRDLFEQQRNNILLY